MIDLELAQSDALNAKRWKFFAENFGQIHLHALGSFSGKDDPIIVSIGHACFMRLDTDQQIISDSESFTQNIDRLMKLKGIT